MQCIARDRKHLGADIGFLAVLHTWTQTLQHHPHLHCVVPGGGLAPDGSRWIPSRERFFLSVKVLSRLFRGKFLALLAQTAGRGELRFGGGTASLAAPGAWAHWLRQRRSQEWVVYAKPPFGSPEHVLKYLAAYTHRVAISNGRILAIDESGVTFRYRDRAHDNAPRTMTLTGVEFLRRFLLHVLPKGFVRIRHFGFLAPRSRQKLATCRALLQTVAATALKPADPTPVDTQENHLLRCPHCGVGRLRHCSVMTPAHAMAASLPPMPPRDTS